MCFQMLSLKRIQRLRDGGRLSRVVSIMLLVLVVRSRVVGLTCSLLMIRIRNRMRYLRLRWRMLMSGTPRVPDRGSSQVVR